MKGPPREAVGRLERPPTDLQKNIKDNLKHPLPSTILGPLAIRALCTEYMVLDATTHKSVAGTAGASQLFSVVLERGVTKKASNGGRRLGNLEMSSNKRRMTSRPLHGNRAYLFRYDWSCCL
mmetsp:Transcript_8280/g.24865  ORF Transcript_8280/g.24865 Transcript_8280/m.24865 type:complete len:122 (-) Transcript_8280:873-1238(-)